MLSILPINTDATGEKQQSLSVPEAVLLKSTYLPITEPHFAV
jgi:hypothetical protein